MLRVLTTALLVTACGGSSSKSAPQVPVTAEVPGGGDGTKIDSDKVDDCEKAQQVELKMWLAELVTDADDELEMFTTLGMILTLTDPETLAELRDMNPESSKATDASEVAWLACGAKPLVNCAVLARAMTETESRLENDGWSGWNKKAIATRCMGGELTFENADCALSATDEESASSCF